MYQMGVFMGREALERRKQTYESLEEVCERLFGIELRGAMADMTKDETFNFFSKDSIDIVVTGFRKKLPKGQTKTNCFTIEDLKMFPEKRSFKEWTRVSEFYFTDEPTVFASKMVIRTRFTPVDKRNSDTLCYLSFRPLRSDLYVNDTLEMATRPGGTDGHVTFVAYYYNNYQYILIVNTENQPFESYLKVIEEPMDAVE
jgi:hypothetical protein